jgi:hypothetical protein
LPTIGILKTLEIAAAPRAGAVAKICGFTQLGSSSVPALSITTPGITDAESAIPEPHTGQKRRSIAWPLSPDLLNALNAPSTDSAGSGTATTIENAEPLNFWQSRQWHTPTNAGSTSAL